MKKIMLSLFLFLAGFLPTAGAETIELVTYFPAGAAAGGGDQQVRSIRVGDAAYQAQPAPPVGVGLFQQAVGIGIPVPGGGAPTLPAGVVLGVQGAPGETDQVVFLPGAGGTLNVGIGTATPNDQLELTGNLRLPTTTATAGIIRSGGNLFIHSFGGNFFAGLGAGNLTMSGVVASGENTGVGTAVLRSNTTGYYNSAVGARSLSGNTGGRYNTASGHSSLYSNTTGDANVAVGSEALRENTTGGGNIAIGSRAGASVSFPDDGRANVTGSNNTFIGANALPGSQALTNATAIGANALVSVSNAMVLGGTDANAVNVGISNPSPTAAASPANGQATGNLDVNDIFLRSKSRWVTQGSVNVVKSTDETVASSSELQDDNHLNFSMGANETWQFERGTVINGSTPGLFVFRWAQKTASAQPTTVRRGSYLRAFVI